MKNIAITLRKKDISNGARKSLYLDYYPAITLSDGKKTRREFLKLYLFTTPSNGLDREHNKETLKIAEAIRARRVLEFSEGKHGFVGAQTRKIDFFQYFEKLADDEKRRRGNLAGNKTSTLKHLRLYQAQGATVADVDEGFIRGFKSYLLDCDSLGQNSKSIYLRQLKSVLTQAVKERLFNFNPADNVSNIKTTDVQIEYLTKKELKKLRKTKCSNDLLRRYFLFGCYTGLRHSDILTLKWSEIKEADNGLAIEKRMKKTKKTVHVPLTEKAQKIIGMRGKAEEKVFEEIKLSTSQGAMLSTWVKDAKIGKHITFHCSRHTFATSLLSAGVDIYTVSKLLGHSTVKMTERYAKVIDKKKNEAIRKLDSFF